jgi:ATP/maltotriose-dependent transcriptional regulator MalT
VGVIADALLALLDLEEHRHTAAEARITQALVRLDSAGLQDGLASAPLTGARAWLELVHNDRAAARVHLEQATSLVSRTLVVPWLATYLQIVLSRVALEVEDLATAQSLLAAARRELMRHPDAGMLPHMLANAECAREAAQGGDKALIEPLTPAELRVLELARTCLSIEEMGRTLCVSKNTVKTHLKAIYAKLTVASRSEAVERARALHLIA